LVVIQASRKLCIKEIRNFGISSDIVTVVVVVVVVVLLLLLLLLMMMMKMAVSVAHVKE
jgi:hypothetical protein